MPVMQVSYDYHANRSNPQKKRGGVPRVSFSKKKLSFRKKRSWKPLAWTVLVLFFVGAIASVAGLGMISRNLPDPNRLIDRSLPQSTKIYDRTGKVLLYEFHGDQERTLVTLDQIPTYLKNATITSEDKNFYSHGGFDVIGILRALFVDVVRGGKVEGGSTITQQLIKNALLTNEKSYVRKIKELVLAYQIEKKFSKDQILQMYFNEIPYGSTAYGVRAASFTYFGKDVKDLDLAESAALTVLPRAPTYYSPWGNNRDKLIEQQHVLLDSMVGQGYISQAEADDAKKEKLDFRPQANSLLAPHFVMYVRQLLTDTYGEQMVDEGGLTVTTTLDYTKQKIAEDTVTQWGKRNLAYKATNAALVSIDARTGEVLAMVGSRDYYDTSIDGNVNVVLRPRQPGSSFKPVVYAAAFQKGYTPSTLLFDVKTNFDTTGQKPYEPQNYTKKEYGQVTMTKALAGSLNIPAVKTLYLAGLPTVIDLAKNLGYTTLQDPGQYGLSLVLGGGDVTLFEHTAAYTAFAQDGTRAVPAVILKVQDANGNILQQFQQQNIKTPLDPETVRNIDDILSNQSNREYVFGVHNYLQLPGHVAAAKTGTTNDFRDAWTIGWTPSIVTGVWVGNNDNSPMRLGADGSQVAAPIWRDYMEKTLGDNQESFQKPLPTTTGKGVLDGVVGSQVIARYDAETGQPATDQTPPDRIEQKISTALHTILFYITKDDPRGPIPDNPQTDPQFALWEAGVKDWAARNHIPQQGKETTVLPPTTPPENQITLSINSPGENDTVTNPSFDATISTSSPKGITQVDYFIDSTPIGSSSTAPFFLHTTLSGISNGFRTLRVVATDASGATQEAHLTLNLLLP